ncbi:hypothetical protein DL239_21370, partial [Sedimentitalea sp. CY04]
LTMSKIEDPWHSRPIDVHRWSEHPEVKEFVGRIWDKYLPAEVVGKSGPKPKMAFRKQLRVLILDLYVAWLDDPELCIGVKLDVNAWKTGSRYNALHLSKKMIPIIYALCEAGLIDLAKGSHGSEGARGNRTTRIRASEGLQEWFAEAKFGRDDVGRAENEEVIFMKDDSKKQIEYADSPDTNRMREDLQAYNKLITGSFIDIPSLQDPVIETAKSGESKKVRLNSGRTHRTFSRSNWDMNGRFYGGWWQQINSIWRAKITIDTEPTIEADYQGLHVAMLYAEAGKELTHDPYLLPQYKNLSFPPKLVRTLAKQLVLTAINAKEKSSAYKAFRGEFPEGHAGKNMTNKYLDELLEAILARNPSLSDYLFTDQGICLMRKDSDITAFIHNHFTKKGIPVLSVHDSYIVDCNHVGELRRVMADASEAVVGRPLKSSVNIPGREEFEPVDEAALKKHIHELEWAAHERVEPACEGYVERVLAYMAKTGRSIGPYGEEPWPEGLD